MESELREPDHGFDPPPEPQIQDAQGSEEFDPRWREPFRGLLHLGALIRSFSWMGHTFTIRTLTVEEGLTVGQFCRRWGDTMAATKGYQTAMVAAMLVEVDGELMPVALGAGETPLTVLQIRYDKVKHWFAPTFDAIYQEYMLLEEEQNRILDAMGKALAQGPIPIPG